MTRKLATAAKEAQPDLLGGAPQTISIEPVSGTLKVGQKITGPGKKSGGIVVQTEKPPSGGASARPATALAVVAPQRSMLAVLADAAANPKVDALKVRELYAIQKEMAQDQAKADFAVAFRALQGELPSIGQDGKIEIAGKDSKRGQKTLYASFNNIHKTIKPILERHGFSLSFETEPEPGGQRIIVKGILEHVAPGATMSHVRTTAFPLPAETSGSKNNVQGWGSSFSYGKRYCAIALLNIVSHAPRDADLDGNPGKPPKEIEGEAIETKDAVITGEQNDTLVKAIEFCGVGLAKFCKHYEIKKVDDLPAELFGEAMKACADFKAKRAA